MLTYKNMTVTKENFNEVLQNREIRDILSSYTHPNEFRNADGYTFLDYVLWKTKRHGKPLVCIINDINRILKKEEESDNSH